MDGQNMSHIEDGKKNYTVKGNSENIKECYNQPTKYSKALHQTDDVVKLTSKVKRQLFGLIVSEVEENKKF